MRRFYPFIFPGLLVFLTSIISYLNYTPGTFLSGWDTLHPEFNFPKQFENVFYGVFRSDQGLGAIAAHSHMADLPRILFLYLESFILPLSFLRYSYIFLCLMLGPLGIFYFVKKVLSSRKNIHTTNYFLPDTAAFLAALFYLFNLGTVQHFIVPFEMFTTQYAFLPWLFLTAILCIEKPNAKRLFAFSLISFLAAPMAYAAVLWYAYFTGLLLFLLTIFLLKREKKVFKSILFIILASIITNAFWLFPNLYFLLTTAKDVSLAQTNRLFSDEAFLHNKQYGTFLDTIIFKNFLFNWNVQENVTTIRDLLGVWKLHLSSPFTAGIGYGMFLISIFGIFFALFKKYIYASALLPVFLLSIIMIMNMNPPFDVFFSQLRESFPLFKEGLRFPYTKFSLLLIFSTSVFIGITLQELFHHISHVKHFPKYFFVILFSILFSLFSIFYCLPMFTGNLIDRSMRVTIPEEYFELFNYLQSKPDSSRVAPLPIHSLWGWEYYDWGPALNESEGYQGAGFLWFGIPQPTLSRDFDRWNPSNEQYFREMNNAIYSRDTKLVESLAEKYHIKYFILDKSIIFPGNKQNALWHYETQNTFEKTQNIQKIKDFGESLQLYEYKNTQNYSLIEAPTSYGSVGPQLTGGFLDTAVNIFSTYIEEQSPLVYYPARNFVDRYSRIESQNVTVQDGILTLKVSSTIPDEYQLTQAWLSDDIYPQFMKDLQYDLITEELSLPYRIAQNVFLPIASVSAIQDITTITRQSNECGEIRSNTLSDFTTENNAVTFHAVNGSSCGYINFPQQQQDFGNILMLEAKNVTGLPIRMCVTNKLSRKCDIYTSLDTENTWKTYYFMIPPQPSGDSGYAVHFNTVSIGNIPSENQIRTAHMIQIPYYRLGNLAFVKNQNTLKQNGISLKHIEEINPTKYIATLQKKGSQAGLITFMKAYSPGWNAYIASRNPNFFEKTFPFWFGTKLDNHVLVNNWANGWVLPEARSQKQGTITIIFLPQYLQYAGFLLLGGFMLILTAVSIKSYLKNQ